MPSKLDIKAPGSSVVGGFKSGYYYYAHSASQVTTNNGLGNNSIKTRPFVAPEAFTIVRIGLEFTVAGEANSVVRLGWFLEDGDGLPGVLLQDFGTISTGTGDAGDVDTAGVVGTWEITVANLVIPKGLSFPSAAVQGSPTTQPTLRVTNVFDHPAMLAIGTSKPAAGANTVGYGLNSVSGAFPASWTNPGTNNSQMPRIFFKVA